MTQEEYEIDDAARAELQYCYDMAQKWHGVSHAMYRLIRLCENDHACDDALYQWAKESWLEATDNYVIWTVKAGELPYSLDILEVKREWMEWPIDTPQK